jgi:N-acetylmuramoyl-L-alanine amidase
MALQRVWRPSPNNSGGGTKRLLVIHTTEGFTGPNGMYDLADYFAKSSSGASSQVGIDNTHPGVIVEMVKHDRGAWTQCNYNSVSVSVEQCGYASWSRDTWLKQKEPLLRNVATWLAEESKRFGIPLTKLTPSAAQGSGRGVCYHSDLGSVGCGHSDPGSGYPIDVVLSWAQGGGGSQPQPQPPKPTPVEDEDMPSYTVPPKSVTGLAHMVSLPGMHKAMGVCVDTGVLSPPNTQLRAAFHTGGTSWEVIQVYCDPSHQKVVVWPKKPFDGVSLTRIDGAECYIVADFGK